MIRERFHRHPATDRATDLDPTTFSHPEELQMTPADYRARAWVWRGIFAWCAACLALGGWAISELAGW